ncbi:MAG TPA: site-2 protease family protein [Pyrinomonadaceae bacterium]|nr:site-2 protease family protein [Pyrinomonadaceae bacterium]
MDESIRSAPPALDIGERRKPWLSAREWRVHGGLFLLTVLTTTLAGTMLATPELPVPTPRLATPLDYLLYIPLSYLYSSVEFLRYAFGHPHMLAEGAIFSVSLLAILFSHEMGHYLACRYYKVNATLPYFIPAPPLFLAGTFGAFIKIRSAIPSRRALFDIGLAGPLAGFVVALPVAVIGVLTQGAPLDPSGHWIFFNDPLLFRLISKLAGMPLDPNTPTNPYYMAAWIGLLVTSLNLMPVGQLDGGHGTFSLFGARAHTIIGRLAFVTMAALAFLGFWWHGSPSGFLYAVLLAVMMKVPHPQPAVMEPLGTKRVVIALLTLIVFALCFLPFPITIS